ncbi:5-formyltetrahydrofolate cyclo-ligase [Propionicicella superfundia]|uniref:5-formyltetrahydrofolate cyclo-ligase n=1 Tax=Propionicicella superfundia TaxID=348582 RepID=UPI0003F9A558|nr:5-formyltetrahydrofolate cyclo-ligase [Propionicicella superfundia]
MTTSAPVRPSHNAGPGKADLRREILRLRALRSRSEREAADASRTELLVELSAQHATIACYVSQDPEPGTLPLLDVLYRRGRRVLIPWMGDGSGPLEIGWGRYQGPESLVPGPRGILQPAVSLGAEALAEASLVLCPALAATPTGIRLGTGGGWYDRALLHASARAKTACLVDDDEVFPSLPTDPWDVRMDLIATQTRLRVWRDK